MSLDNKVQELLYHSKRVSSISRRITGLQETLKSINNSNTDYVSVTSLDVYEESCKHSHHIADGVPVSREYLSVAINDEIRQLRRWLQHHADCFSDKSMDICDAVKD